MDHNLRRKTQASTCSYNKNNKILTDEHWLNIPKTKYSQFGQCAFTVIAPTYWNKRPGYIRTISNFVRLTKDLKNRPIHTFKPNFDCCFSTDDPRLWNGLPDDVRLVDTLASFRNKRKAHLFREAHPPWYYLSWPCGRLITNLAISLDSHLWKFQCLKILAVAWEGSKPLIDWSLKGPHIDTFDQ